MHDLTINRLALEGTIKVHQMQASCPASTQRAAIATGSSEKIVASSILP